MPKITFLIKMTNLSLLIKRPCSNKMCLTLSPLSFDDNKVLKSQLDMLIFVQVCMTINKKFINDIYSTIGSERTKESKGIYKGSLCCKTKSEDQQCLKTIRS